MSNKKMIFRPLDSLELVMWEKTMMPESVIVKGNDGKSSFSKTGKVLEYTTYSFRDSFGDKFVFTSKNNDWRTLEGEQVIISLDLKFDEFKRKTKISLSDVVKA